MQGVQALIATANRRLAEWACERLQAAEITVCEEAADLESAVLLAVELFDPTSACWTSPFPVMQSRRSNASANGRRRLAS